MVMRSDFIQEDVELDENWTPKRSAGAQQAGNNRFARNGGMPQLRGDFAEFLQLIFRLAGFVGIFILAIKSLKPHGGVLDFFIWLAVDFFYFRHAFMHDMRPPG